jgi:hypothetical protein
VSNGFGRRLRYLVWDNYHDKLIGLIAIGDPVFNLSVRDQLVGWNAKERGDRLVNIMDAYVLGALPPYNMLLGRKLVAPLVRSRDIYDDFTRAYGGTTGIISKKETRTAPHQRARATNAIHNHQYNCIFRRSAGGDAQRQCTLQHVATERKCIRCCGRRCAITAVIVGGTAGDVAHFQFAFLCVAVLASVAMIDFVRMPQKASDALRGQAASG